MRMDELYYIREARFTPTAPGSKDTGLLRISQMVEKPPIWQHVAGSIPATMRETSIPVHYPPGDKK